MEKLKHFAALVAVVALLSSCSTVPTGTGTNALKQSFGDYVRSLEGTVASNAIPSLIVAGRDKWLPKGAFYDQVASSIIHSYVAAHPTNNAQVNTTLEALATDLNLSR